ncbi:DNA excision repair protein ERCC-1 [Andrographis paniculata]|uniref:DNA excision repair protein ERCC-1 n=1 Tax=Andrographis paniculata TaxID=175694 RepID=UPI0021E8F7DD|nr:DNA excision repair protein ERCC-1 [Andrographis paniculata]
MEQPDGGGDGKRKDDAASFTIRVPSYEEVVEASQSRTAPQSLFTPSFSQAFNFVKNSEFYETPVPAPAPASSSQTSQASPLTSQTPPPRQIGQSEGPSTSVSTSGGNRNAILVSHRQKGNPLLKHIRNVRWAFADVVCDYVLGQNACALYLSLRYHLLHPDYLYFRIRELQKNFKLRVVLCHVDVEDVVKPLLEVTKTALLHDCTLLCGWSLEECGRYLETIKVYENKPADLIQGQMDMDYQSRLHHVLTSIRHVNKTDVVTLGSTFGSLANIMDASMEDLSRCPGIGEKKVKRLYDTFHEPFKRTVPTHTPAAGNLTDANTAPAPAPDTEENEAKKKSPRASKRKKIEPEVSVKSALKAAFAKYPRKKKDPSEADEKGKGTNENDDHSGNRDRKSHFK